VTDAEPDYVTPRRRVDGPVVLAEPDPAWPERFAREEARIRGALGERALLVEHVGSTSVPGLAAKPILDIVLAVADPGDESAYVVDLEAAGYVLHLREPGWRQHRLLKGAEPAVNLHVFAAGDSEIDRMVGFRNHMRTHSEDCALYERTKRELAAQQWAVVQDYADAKTEVVEGIVRRAGLPPGSG
jgi:GrpB-like predicted nucleotidyltransferase (UPF0157 family)